MINEEARGDPTALGGGKDKELDYSKPFRLFDEQGLGVIPVDQFRVMLYRLHVNSLLRERQVVALIDRFDVNRNGEFGRIFGILCCACCCKHFWTQESKL